MAQNLNKVKRRIQTIESTKKVTSAMKLVSSVKFSQLQREFHARDLYFNSIQELTNNVLSAAKGENVDGYYLNENRTSEKILYVVVTSSLGLCGSYNYNVIKTFTNLYKNGDEVLPIGTTGYNLLKKEKDLIIHDKFVNIMENLEISKIRILEKYLFKLFKEKKFKKIVLLYTHYKNAISFQVKSFDLLPITFDLVEKTKLNPGDYDPNIASFAHRVAKKFVISTIYIKLFESFLSEQASRRNAMENADKNASELIDKLKIQFNKARQAAITQEITEVVAGSLNKWG